MSAQPPAHEPANVADSATAALMSKTYRGVVIGLLAIITSAAFEAMAVTTAMPVVAKELNGESSYGLAFSLLLTASLAATAAAGPWCDAKGPKPSLIFGLLGMCAGLLLSGFAGTFAMFAVGRMLSGLGTGLMIVPVYVIIGQVIPARHQPALFSWFSAAWVVPALVGPWIAGVLASHGLWRWVFYGVAPIVLVAVALVWPRVKDLGPPEEKSMGGGEGRGRAVTGIVLSVGVLAAQWGAHELADGASGLRTAIPVVLVLLTLVGLAGVVLAAPRLMPSGTFRLRPGLASVMATRGLMGLAFAGAEAFVPLMLTSTRGLDPSLAGLTLTGGAIGWTAGSVFQARTTLSRTALLTMGASLLTLAMGGLVLVTYLNINTVVFAVVWAVCGISMGMSVSSTSVLMLKLSPAHERGRNSASLQLADMLGSVMGTAGAGTFFSLMLNPSHPSDSTVFVILWGALAVAAAVGIASGSRSRSPHSEVFTQ